MKDLFTIVYYTSNKENESFENKIKEKLLANCGDIPIISVSQKPINLGFNICVGEVGANYLNLHRQIQIGCMHATTPFIISAESDCLYPPDYFKIKPFTINKCYLYNNIYTSRIYGEGFRKKDICFGALIIGREFFLKKLDVALGGKPMWGTSPVDNINRFWDKNRDWELYGTKNPVVSFKTGNGLARATKTYGDPIETIPYWGSSKELKKEFLDG